MKFPNLHIFWTTSKNLEIPGALSRNTPPELITRKTTEIPQSIKFFVAKDKTSSRLKSKSVGVIKTDLENAQMNSLQHFPLYLDWPNNHYW